MNRFALPIAALALLALPALAQEEAAVPSPGEIVAQAAPSEWIAIAPEDLLVMDLGPAADGSARRIVIQLISEPFSQGWVQNIRTLARANWYDGISVNRVQDNYVVQWGDADGEDEAKAKPLPGGLRVMGEGEYIDSVRAAAPDEDEVVLWHPKSDLIDSYADSATFEKGWPIGLEVAEGTRILNRWPIHCYGMVGVGRSMSPDTGSGAELYTVIGHAPRHLDRNIAVVGRIVEGMEHLSSLPRGHGPLGFYDETELDKRTRIASVRIASDLAEAERPKFEYLATDGATFARYADARANRRDPFFIVPAGGADVCNIPVPVRRVGTE